MVQEYVLFGLGNPLLDIQAVTSTPFPHPIELTGDAVEQMSWKSMLAARRL